MKKYLLTRIVLMALTLWMVITITFVLMYAVPGGPFTKQKKIPPAIMEALNEKYHLDDPLHVQYIDYLKGVVKFDLGPSFKHKGQDVKDFIKNGFPVSAKLGLISISFSIIFGVCGGVIAAIKQGGWQDFSLLIMATLGVCIPGFVIATLLIYVFGLKLGWLPVYGIQSWKGFVLPVMALSGYTLSFITRLVRSSMLEVLQQEYIMTARAYGMSEIVVIFKHALRNAIIPVVSFVGPMISIVLAGSFVIERIFALPGMGRYFVESITNRDYTTIMGITIFDTVLLVLAVLLVDILYGWIDPRIKVHD